MNNSTETAGELVGRTTSRPPFRQILDNIITDSADAWSLSRTSIVAIFVAPAFVAASGIAAAFAGKSFYRWYTEEDGFAESLQVLLYATSLVISLLVLRHHWQLKNRILTILYAFLACGLVFMVGEELSWGQRIFGWQTPQSLVALNKQNESNLHNINGVGSTFKWVQGLVGAYGAFLPLVFLRKNFLSRFRLIIDSVVPHYLLIVFFLPMFCWRLFRNLSEDPVRYYYVITNYNEIIELILAMGFCLFLIFQLRKCRRQKLSAIATS